MIKDNIAKFVIEYYSNFPHLMREDILHTQEVVSYTRLIAIGEGQTEEQVDLLECAAWLHDIGCPRSKEIFGNSLPINQQNVGREVTTELLKSFDELSQAQKDWLADVVGRHHQHKYAIELEFAPLFEADLIVNILSGYYKPEQAEHLFSTLMTTNTGRELFKKVVG